MAAKNGQALENAIEYTNNLYKAKGKALIHKEPTPWNVSYNPKKRINVAFPEKKGTVDFKGVSQGRPIAFDAKSTKNKTSFPLANVQDHQIDYLDDHQNQGGISFFIVEFEAWKESYFIEFDQLHSWWIDSKREGRKSIPYKFFKDECDLIKSRNGVALDYLEHV